MRKCIFKSLNMFLPYNTPGSCLLFPSSFPWCRSNLFAAELGTLQSLGQLIGGGVFGLQGQYFATVQTEGCDVRTLRKKTEEKKREKETTLKLAWFKFSLNLASFKCEKVQLSTCINKRCLQQKCLVVPNNGFAL